MDRLSSIDALPDELRAAIQRAIAERRLTVDGLVELVNEAGHSVSRSAMGRYRKTAAQRLATLRETQEIAGEWMAQVKAQPDGDVGQLLAEMLKLLAYQTQMDMQLDEKAIDPLQLTRLSQMIRNLATADVTRTKLREEANKAARAEAADISTAVAREAGLSEDRVAQIRRDVLGIRPEKTSGATA